MPKHIDRKNINLADYIDFNPEPERPRGCRWYCTQYSFCDYCRLNIVAVNLPIIILVFVALCFLGLWLAIISTKLLCVAVCFLFSMC